MVLGQAMVEMEDGLGLKVISIGGLFIIFVC